VGFLPENALISSLEKNDRGRYRNGIEDLRLAIAIFVEAYLPDAFNARKNFDEAHVQTETSLTG
jgi:hypothetical protein